VIFTQRARKRRANCARSTFCCTKEQFGIRYEIKEHGRVHSAALNIKSIKSKFYRYLKFGLNCSSIIWKNERTMQLRDINNVTAIEFLE